MSNLTQDSRSSRQIMIRRITATGILTAMAVVLMFQVFQVPIPPFPGYLKLDIADFPALIGSFAIGPFYGIIIELFKNLIHMLTSPSGFPIGEISNFVVGSVYVFTAGLIYSKKKTRVRAAIAMVIAVLAMATLSVPWNYFVTLPAYGMKGTPITYVIKWFIPFNLIKGSLVSFITFWIYKPISRLIHDTYRKTH